MCLLYNWLQSKSFVHVSVVQLASRQLFIVHVSVYNWLHDNCPLYICLLYNWLQDNSSLYMCLLYNWLQDNCPLYICLLHRCASTSVVISFVQWTLLYLSLFCWPSYNLTMVMHRWGSVAHGDIYSQSCLPRVLDLAVQFWMSLWHARAGGRIHANNI